MLSFFPRGVLDEILNLIESVSEDFPSYSCNLLLTEENNRSHSVLAKCLNAIMNNQSRHMTKLLFCYSCVQHFT